MNQSEKKVSTWQLLQAWSSFLHPRTAGATSEGQGPKQNLPLRGRSPLGAPGPSNGQRATCEPGVCTPVSSQRSRAHTGRRVSPTERPGVQSEAKKHWSRSSHPTFLTVVKAREQSWAFLTGGKLAARMPSEGGGSRSPLQ